jgi:predicted CXXCH cytochrome family protein
MPRVLASILIGLLALGAATSLRGESPWAHGTSLLRGCGSCHVGHGKRATQMLPAAEEQLCYRCHGGPAARGEMERRGLLAKSAQLRDVSADFRLPYRHPVELGGAHRPGEVLPEREAHARRHAECVDCHRPHRTARGQSGLARRVGARSSLDGRSPEYELCYRCHAESVNLPRSGSNVRRRFALSNPSYHPIEAAGKGRHVPSLRQPLTTASLISCSDCHGSDAGRGMHGSTYPYLLKQPYATAARTPEGPRAYALCYGCHDRQTLFSGRGFSEHDRHVRGARASCATCHTAHGSLTSPHLVEFSAGAVTPDSQTGKLGYVSLGQGRGQCYLRCHGVDHPGTGYCESGRDCPTGGKQSPLKPTQPIRDRLRGSPFSF